MGLDTVELLLAIEEEFTISIPDEDAEKLVTPGHVATYVMTRVRTSPDEACPSLIGFYRVRSVLVRSFDIPRNEVKPKALLEPFLQGNIREQWGKLERALGAQNFPALERTMPFLVTAVFVFPALIAIGLLGGVLPWTWVLVAYVCLTLAADRITAQMGSVIPASYQTVGSLIPLVGCASAALWSYDSALARIIEITSEQLGIPIEGIQADSRFVQDLGAG